MVDPKNPISLKCGNTVVDLDQPVEWDDKNGDGQVQQGEVQTEGRVLSENEIECLKRIFDLKKTKAPKIILNEGEEVLHNWKYIQFELEAFAAKNGYAEVTVVRVLREEDTLGKLARYELALAVVPANNSNDMGVKVFTGDWGTSWSEASWRLLEKIGSGKTIDIDPNYHRLNSDTDTVPRL